MPKFGMKKLEGVFNFGVELQLFIFSIAKCIIIIALLKGVHLLDHLTKQSMPLLLHLFLSKILVFFSKCNGLHMQ